MFHISVKAKCLSHEAQVRASLAPYFYFVDSQKEMTDRGAVRQLLEELIRAPEASCEAKLLLGLYDLLPCILLPLSSDVVYSDCELNQTSRKNLISITHPSSSAVWQLQQVIQRITRRASVIAAANTFSGERTGMNCSKLAAQRLAITGKLDSTINLVQTKSRVRF